MQALNLDKSHTYLILKSELFTKTRIVAYDNKNFGDNRNGDNRNNESLFSKRIKAGKRRTYFFDVRSTRGNDYFVTITESKKRFDDNGYDRHKMFLYKEDFNKFLVALTETIDYVKTDLMPDFDFDAYNHDQDEEGGMQSINAESDASTDAHAVSEVAPVTVSAVTADEGNVDDWKI